VCLRLLDEMSHEEIASLLGSTTGAVRQQYHRARTPFGLSFTALRAARVDECRGRPGHGVDDGLA
jgi:hypothetical protein